MDEQDKSWQSTPDDFDIDGETAHVWSIRLNLSSAKLEAFADTLTPMERQRAQSFHFDRDRQRFIAGRGTLRTILGRYLLEDPAEVELGYESQGKPKLTGCSGSSDLQFNLSHCEDLAVLAVTRGRLVGVDVERERELQGVLQLVATICSPRQIAEFGTLSRNEQNAAFVRLWTRKEAWLKATGDGIGTSLDTVEPEFRADVRPTYRSLPKRFAKLATKWSLYELVPLTGFIAALALERTISQLVCRPWIKQNAIEYA